MAVQDQSFKTFDPWQIRNGWLRVVPIGTEKNNCWFFAVAKLGKMYLPVTHHNSLKATSRGLPITGVLHCDIPRRGLFRIM